jgi:signal peptidase II
MHPNQTEDTPTGAPASPETLPSLPGFKETLRRYLPLIFGGGALIALDTWTKAWVHRFIPFGGMWLPDGLLWLHPYARLVHTRNTGTAFSMFAGLEDINLVIGVLAAVVSLLVFLYFPRIPRQEKMLRAALVLQFAGAVGNLVSRVQYGYVVDFVSVGSFAVFNVADASITVGVAVLLLTVILEEWKERRKKKTASEVEE